MEKQQNGYEAVIELLRDHPEWHPVVIASLEEAQAIKGSRIAGAWILQRAKERGVQWVPNFRKLVSYGILQKDGESTRGGRRAYYSMPDIKGVERALKEFVATKNNNLYAGHRVTDSGIEKLKSILVPLCGNLASCGSLNDAESYVEDYIEVNTELAKPGHQYFLVKADGDSMNLAGINSGDLVLVRVQDYANVGEKVVARNDDGGTIKEFHRQGNKILLMPRSDNPTHKPLLLDNIKIQGVVLTTIPQ